MLIAEAVDVAAQAAAALSAAHEAGITHRDIKPENVMVRRDRIVKVLDFGLAKLTEPSSPAADSQAPTAIRNRTESGVVMGTPRYMSPEQARGERADARTDVFSLGVMLYEMVAGRAPFAGETASEIIAAILRDEPPPLTAAPPALERVISRCLAKERAERYQSAADLLADLRQLQRRLEFAAEAEREFGIAPADDLKFVRSASPSAGAEASSFAAGTRHSIAVLPFANLSAEAENEYFCDGLAEELLNALAKIEDLKVAARTSAFSFKGKHANVSQIGRALSVRTVLGGGVRKSGRRLRITVQLVNASDGYHLWSERYDRELQDVFDVQDEITLAVVDALKVQLLGAERAAVLKRHTDNTEAYELYLKGRFFLNQVSAESLSKAVGYFTEATRKDSRHALAYAGLADCYSRLPIASDVPSGEALPKAKAAALKALEIDDRLDEAHACLGWLKFWFDWNWDGAEREYRRAVEINTNNAYAYLGHAHLLSNLGRHREALEEVDRALRLDPLSLITGALKGLFLYAARRYAEAIDQLHKTLEINPHFWVAQIQLGKCYERVGRYEEALAAFRRAREYGGTTEAISLSGYTYAASGRRAEAERALRELQTIAEQGYVPPYNIALINHGLGNSDEALRWLERAYQERDARMVFLGVETKWDTLRHDPRFIDLLRRVGLQTNGKAPSESTNEASEAPTASPVPAATMAKDVFTKPDEITGQTFRQKLPPAGRMTTKPRRAAFIALTAVVISLAALAAWFYFNRSPLLTGQDTVLLADFDNKTGDAIFDGALRQWLATQLEQSQMLRVFPEARVQQTLRQMERPSETRVTAEIAGEVCERQNLKAFIAGSIAPLGSRYVLTLEAVQGQNGEVLARAQAEAESKEQVLEALSEAATRLGAQLGRSLSSIQLSERPLQQVTTADLRAVKALSECNYLAARGRFVEALPFCKRAAELDPQLAGGYTLLAIISVVAGQPEAAAEYQRKAVQLSEERATRQPDQVSEVNKMAGLAYYHRLTTGNQAKAQEYGLLYRQLAPRHTGAHNDLGFAYVLGGQFEQAIPPLQVAIRLNPNFAAPYRGLAEALTRLNRFAEAKDILTQALSLKLEFTEYHTQLYQLAFIEEDAAGMQQQLDWAKGKPEEYVALDWQSRAAAFAGRWQQAQEFSRQAVNLARLGGNLEVAARYATEHAVRSAVMGDCRGSRASVARGLDFGRGRLPLSRAALALALCGEAKQAQSLVDELTKRFPEDTLANSLWAPTTRATIALRRGDSGNGAAHAIEQLQPAARYEAVAEFWPQYLRGQAYSQLKQGAEAAAEFQRILNHRGQAPLSPLYPLAHLGLARAAELTGGAAQSHKAYEDFFAAWKEADVDLPIWIEAKSRRERR